MLNSCHLHSTQHLPNVCFFTIQSCCVTGSLVPWWPSRWRYNPSREHALPSRYQQDAISVLPCAAWGRVQIYVHLIELPHTAFRSSPQMVTKKMRITGSSRGTFCRAHSTSCLTGLCLQRCLKPSSCASTCFNSHSDGTENVLWVCITSHINQMDIPQGSLCHLGTISRRDYSCLTHFQVAHESSHSP